MADPKRLKYLMSGLNRFKLTRCEKQFLELVKGYFEQKGVLTEEQEVMLEGLYREKVRWARLGLISEKGIQKDAHRSS